MELSLQIITDTGIKLYSYSRAETMIDFSNIGVLHALLMTCMDKGAIPSIIKTENGFISYTTIDERIHLILFGKSSSKSSEKAEEYA